MTYEFEGKTEKEAIENAVNELGLQRDQFDVEILEVREATEDELNGLGGCGGSCGGDCNCEGGCEGGCGNCN